MIKENTAKIETCSVIYFHLNRKMSVSQRTANRRRKRKGEKVPS